jgi:hypothetical protein
MNEWSWLGPSIAMTALSGLIAIVLIPDTSGVMPAIGMLPFWMIAAVLFGSLYGVIEMARAGVQHPLSHSARFFVEEWRKLAFWTLCMLLAGINMTTFMWIKPLLNYLVPFWADPMLADIDKVLFLGRDPWTILATLNSTAAAVFYHRGWFVMMILALIVVLSAPPSAQKSAAMLTYFLCWSVVGPLIHMVLPAAGPIFYMQMGYGDRFAALQNVSETREVAAYLWALYAGEGFGPGSGISAMPSLHIATTAWMVLVARAFTPRLFVPTLLLGVAIFLLSIALGWHYAMDGIVGGIAAWLCWRIAHAFYAGRLRQRAIVNTSATENQGGRRIEAPPANGVVKPGAET